MMENSIDNRWHGLFQERNCDVHSGKSIDESAEIEKIINKLAEERDPPEVD
jgi:hypothetical protein